MEYTIDLARDCNQDIAETLECAVEHGARLVITDQTGHATTYRPA